LTPRLVFVRRLARQSGEGVRWRAVIDLLVATHASALRIRRARVASAGWKDVKRLAAVLKVSVWLMVVVSVVTRKAARKQLAAPLESV
jgi:hypothetical protein